MGNIGRITESLLRATDKYLLVVLFVGFLGLSLHRHSWNSCLVVHSDPEGYYMYLPAVFKYGGIHHLPDEEFVGRRINDKGESYTKYTYGVAVFYLPAFLVAHIYTSLHHQDLSVCSPPLAYAINVNGVIWAFIGLYFLRRNLLRYYSYTATWLTLICIALGTNFFHYATFDIAHAHIYNFALVSMIIFLTDGYYRKPVLRTAIALGFLLGWFVLIRPTGGALLVFLPLYRVSSMTALRQRLALLRTQVSHFVVAICAAGVVFIPQLIYWKEMTGSWIKYSYGNERFLFWLQPKIAAVLLDTQNGLFLYSPILLFAVAGLVGGRRDPRVSFPGTILLFGLITYIFASWCCWWFGGAFGHRSYVDYYPIFAFSMALAMERMIAMKRVVIRAALILLIFIFCVYNLRLSALYISYGPWDGPAWRWNWSGWYGLVRSVSHK